MSEVSERFPKGISVEDLISGKVDVDLVLEEMNEVKSIVSLPHVPLPLTSGV